MNTIARFEKVSLSVFKKALNALVPDMSEDEIAAAYDNIRLPERATVGSAGYDLRSPVAFSVGKNEAVTVPTGIRCKMSEGWVLVLCPRSGMGFKSGIHLANTVGIIDQDYYFADNEGHIMVKLVNDSALSAKLEIECGGAVCQGIFLPFGIAEGDEASGMRRGGFGSTGS